MKPLDPRLLRYASAARGYLAGAVLLGLAVTALILIQADLLARLLAGAIRGTGAAALAGPLVALAWCWHCGPPPPTAARWQRSGPRPRSSRSYGAS